MPIYRAPGVYVEETNFRAKSIEAVSTDITAFVGPTSTGQTGNPPELLNSFADFSRLHGGINDLSYSSDPLLKRNYVALAAKAYFDNGGRRLYVASTGCTNLPTVLDYQQALDTLSDIDDISTIAAPGYSARHNADDDAYKAIQSALITFAKQPHAYRFAVLDAPPGVSTSEIRDLRSFVDSSHAALYFPWVTVANPLVTVANGQSATMSLPPSGFICGIYANNDMTRGVQKAPANALIQDALGFEQEITYGQQELLYPLGINCLRTFRGRGNRVWGAHTASSDPEWKYVNVRRYFNYLEKSIGRGTQWAVFEPNTERLWANLRQSIDDFLYSEWHNGALLGSKPEQAFFVKCDRSTMSQNDLDEGRLVCLVGVATVKPAEFVIFKISHLTAGSTP